MYVWLVILLILASIIFGLDFLIRRKGWKQNSKLEKISLLVNMLSAGPYVFLSGLGMLWGIAGNTPETVFGGVIYEVTLAMGGIYFIIAFAAVIVSLILRKKEKAKASIWVNIIAFAYIIAVLGLNALVGAVL